MDYKMSKPIDIKNLQRKKRKQVIKDGMIFKDSFFMKLGSSGQYFIINQDELIVGVEYSESKGKELLDYFNTER